MNRHFKRLLRCTIYLLLCAVALEGLVRVFFSIGTGAGVLLYGIVDTQYDAKFDPKGAVLRWDEQHANTAIHDNAIDNYSKYYPNQHRIHPDESGTTIEATINSRGFRGKNFEQKKDAGVVRIVTLGASSTFGFRTRDDQTYPHLLEEVLNKSLASAQGTSTDSSGARIKRYEVINLGIPHLQSDQIHSLFLAEAVPLDPDIVTFYEGYTDASSGPRDNAAVQQIKKIPMVTHVFREFRRRSLTVAIVANKLFGRTYAAPDAKERNFEAEIQAKRMKFVKSLDSIYQECHKRHILFIVANQQAQSMSVDREKLLHMSYAEESALVRAKLSTDGGVLGLEKFFLIHSELMDVGRQWAQTNSVPFVDVIAGMDRDRQFLIDWMHLNARGNQFVAAALSETILNR